MGRPSILDEIPDRSISAFDDKRVSGYWDPDGVVGYAIADDVAAFETAVYDVCTLSGVATDRLGQKAQEVAGV